MYIPFKPRALALVATEEAWLSLLTKIPTLPVPILALGALIVSPTILSLPETTDVKLVTAAVDNLSKSLGLSEANSVLLPPKSLVVLMPPLL